MTKEISEHEAMRGTDFPVPSEEDQKDPLFQLLLRVLGRTPLPHEITVWKERISAKPGVQNFIANLMGSRPVQAQKFVRAKNPPGHFFSPVVDPDLVQEYVETNRLSGPTDLGGIDFHLDDMMAFWTRNRAVIAATPFPETLDPAFRYSFTGGPYGYGDATTLRAMIADNRPKRIVEIGSGYSTAVMLDSAEELGLDDLRITCIEPYADRLRSIMRPGDEQRLTLIEEGVQGQPKELFTALEPGDILFIDSTHVVKTGSDVHYELFSILPLLKPGVIVHFHDCRFPLEYSDIQIFRKNYSWNEAYVVRALLMYSSRFRVIFSGSLFARENRALVQDTYPTYLKNPGSALWLKVMEDGSGPFGDPHFDVRARPGGTPRPEPRPAPSAPAATALPQGNAADRRFHFIAKPGDDDHQVATVQIGSTPISFDVRTTGHGPVFFSLGIRKSGSTLLHKITSFMARRNTVTPIDVPGTFFSSGLKAADWAHDLDLEPLVQPQNILTGFRSFPGSLASSPQFAAARKVFMYRNPLDALVSQYFSDAFSHSLPKENENADGRERFMKKREAASNTDINEWVLHHDENLQSTMMDFAPMLTDETCLILRYEDMIFQKSQVIDEIAEHFGWSLTENEKMVLLESVDVVPDTENKTRFIRKAVPGDHEDKLSKETIAELKRRLAPALTAFGYPD